MSESDRDRRIVERIIEAERRAKRQRPEPPKRRWLRTKCPHCKYKIDYSPTDKFEGRIRCPNCGREFKVTRLDDFTP